MPVITVRNLTNEDLYITEFYTSIPAGGSVEVYRSSADLGASRTLLEAVEEGRASLTALFTSAEIATEHTSFPRFGYSSNSVVKELYVATTGSDSNPGTQERPFASPQRAVDEIGPFGHGEIICAAGSYTRPLLRGLTGVVHIRGEGFTEVDSQTAAGGTGAQVVVGTGFTTDAHIDQFVIFDDGAAAGQIRLIAENTTANIVPVRDFDPAPSSGDAFRIVTPAVFFTGYDAAPMAERCGARTQSVSLTQPEPTERGHLAGGLYLENIELEATVPTYLRIVDSTVYMHGVVLGNNCSRFYLLNSEGYSGADDGSGLSYRIAVLRGVDPITYAGWGLARHNTRVSAFKSFFSGYFNGAQQTVTNGGHIQMAGGHVRERISALVGGVVEVNKIAAPISRVSFSGSNPTIRCWFGGGPTMLLTTGVEVINTVGPAVALSMGAVGQAAGDTILTGGNYALDLYAGGQMFSAFGGNPNANWTGGTAAIRFNGSETAAANLPNAGDIIRPTTGSAFVERTQF